LAAIDRALAEDIGSGDATTDSIIPSDAAMAGRITAKQSGVIAGLDVAMAVYVKLDPKTEFTPAQAEGSRVLAGQSVATVAGAARALLKAERTALNCLGRMSGIATLTRQFVEAVAGTKAVILDTRKTAPGLRMLDKLAVTRGGGKNHRLGLYDLMLIKDNHIDFAGGIREAVRRARLGNSRIGLEIEARTLEDVRLAIDLGVQTILLDNMSIEMMSAAVGLAAGGAELEASGNIHLENVRQIAETGVDFISVGALTHSARTLDVSFDYTR
jgi:nicotinate-nucleotide pyrophosphorylase (carboxylating)